MSDGPWVLAAARPLAFGGWEFVLSGPSDKRMEWWPGDTHLSWGGRPFLGAPVARDAGTSARAAAAALVATLNEAEEDADA